MDRILQIPPLVTLRTLREVAGLTSPQLAERIAEHGIDVHPDSILNVERGKRGASGQLLAGFAHAYGIKFVDIWQHAKVLDLATKFLDDPTSEQVA